jgi:primary-amine oxidase
MARFWKISNPSVCNQIGGQTAYKLVPDTKIIPFAPLTKAAYLKRAEFLKVKYYIFFVTFLAISVAFVKHQLWVTPYDRNERFPGGDFPNQSKVVDGLPKWTKKNRSLVDQQLVVWHVFGVTHLPRPGFNLLTYYS